MSSPSTSEKEMDAKKTKSCNYRINNSIFNLKLYTNQKKFKELKRKRNVIVEILLV